MAVARGNEKGRVERAIRFVRDAFFAARTFTDLDDLNAQAKAWCNGLAADRRCPEDLGRSVREVFAEEAPRLMPLPDNPTPLLEQVAVSVGKTPYVRFDLNDYLVPHTNVHRTLTVLADPREVRVVDRGALLACHRSYDRDAQIEQPGHVAALVEQKRAARQHRATDRLVHAAPASQTLLIRAAERGANLGAITAALMRLLAQASAAEMQAAILRRCSGTCRIRTLCASLWRGGASSAASHRRSASRCRRICQHATPRCNRMHSKRYDQLKEKHDASSTPHLPKTKATACAPAPRRCTCMVC